MSTILNHIHSFFAYLFLISCIVSIGYAAYNYFTKSEYTKTQWGLAKMTFISAHIQLLVGLANWFVIGAATMLSTDAKSIMQDALLRKLYVEHPIINIIAIIIISIGYFDIKKNTEDATKNLKNLIFYSIGFILILSRIPWSTWLTR